MVNGTRTVYVYVDIYILDWCFFSRKLGYKMLFTFFITRIIGIQGLLRCWTLLLILSNGVVYLDWLLGALYCISHPANGCSSYTHTYLITTYSPALLMVQSLVLSNCWIVQLLWVGLIWTSRRFKLGTTKAATLPFEPLHLLNGKN